MTASEELAQHLPGRLEDFRRLTGWGITETEENEDIREDRDRELYEYPLSVENLRVVKVLLSTGGPADWLEVLLDDDEPRRIEYHFAPWFDHASVILEGEDFDAADNFCRALTADYYVEAVA